MAELAKPKAKIAHSGASARAAEYILATLGHSAMSPKPTAFRHELAAS